MAIKQVVVETSEVVKTCQPQPPAPSTPAPEAEKKEYKPPKKREKQKRECEILAKIANKRKKP